MNQEELIKELCGLYEAAALCADQAVQGLGASQIEASTLATTFERKSELASRIKVLEDNVHRTMGTSPWNSDQKTQLRLAQERALRSENRLAEVLNNRVGLSKATRFISPSEQKVSGKKLDISK